MEKINVALAQIAPIWFDRVATLEKVNQYIVEAAQQKSQLVVFGEALVPGYPFWIERTHGAKFNSELQKNIQAEYAKQAVQIERGDLDTVCRVAKEHNIAVYLGIIERPKDRSGHSLYCALVYIDNLGEIKSVHRKLMPTYEERLSWSIGDGHGLVTHNLGSFTLGGLNCWENWMPLARTALYAQGEDVHIAVWPGNSKNTADITPFLAKEARSYVISVCGLMRREDVPAHMSDFSALKQTGEDFFANGGSCIAHPDGSWLIEPKIGAEGLYIAELDHRLIRKERHNLDVTGHYARPDVLQLKVNRSRQATAKYIDD